MNRKTSAGILGLMLLAGTTTGQVAQIGGGTAPLNGQWMADATDFGDCYISEVWIDPQDGDASKEYIEFYSPVCNYVLNGKMVVVLTDNSDGPTEVDESFIFPSAGPNIPTYMTNSQGIFVIWNSGDDRDLAAIDTSDTTNSDGHFNHDMKDQAAASDTYESLPFPGVRQTNASGGAAAPIFTDLGRLAVRYEASFDEIGTNGTGGAGDWPGQIENNDSKTILLIDLEETGLDSTEILKLYKDRNPDGDNDGFIEDGEVGSGTGDYLRVIDAVSHSHNGGSEYTPYEGQEWDYSPGYNADAWVRVDIVNTATSVGSMITGDGGGTDDYRQAYGNWLMGEASNTGSGTSLAAAFDNGQTHFGGVPNPGVNTTTDVHGSPNYRLGTSEVLTPGEPNDSFQGKSLTYPTSCASRPGDLNHDGRVDFLDLQTAIDAQDSKLLMTVISDIQR